MVKAILITPYGGANLGDAAIQEAVIRNLRARVRTIDIRMATLAPQRTAALHDVPSFPLTALEVPHYSEGIRAQAQAQPTPSSQAGPETTPAEDRASRFWRARQQLRKLPWLFDALRAGKRTIGALLRFPRTLYYELHHLVGAWRFAQHANYFIVSGGGQIDDYWGGPWGHPYTLMKWSILARLTGAHLVFLSVGVCTLQAPLSRYFMKSALRRASYRSYRDATSKALLADLAFTRHDPVCPDLAFSLPGISTPSSGPPSHGQVIGISPIAYLDSNWPRQDDCTYAAYMQALTALTASLLRDGYPIVLFASDGADWRPVRELHAALLGMSDASHDQLALALPSSVDELFAVLAPVDVVIASRLHGILLSHLAHKPVAAISYDRKVDTHMDYMQQASYCIDIHSVNAVAIDDVLRRLLAQLAESRNLITASCARLTAAANSQYDMIIPSPSSGHAA